MDQKLTWVTSADETQITTTVPMRNKPALYLQFITKSMSLVAKIQEEQRKDLFKSDPQRVTGFASMQ